MTRWFAIRLLLILLALMAAGGGASPLQDAPPETEAARLFREALEEWRAINKEFPQEPYTVNVWYLAGAPEQVDPAEAERFIRRIQPMLSMIRKALDAGDPQFPIQYEDGWDARLSHVTLLRAMVMPLRMDVEWRTHTGQTMGVGEDIGRMFQIGQTLRDDRMIISSLTEIAVFAAGSANLDRALGSGALSQQDAQALLETIDESASGSFFGLADAYENENHYATEWMLGLLNEEGGPEHLRDRLFQFHGYDANVESIAAIAELTASELEPAIHMQSVAMTRAAEILRMDDLDLAKKEFQQLSDEVKAGVYGPIAATSGALAANMMQVLVQAAEMVNTARARLEIVATSPNGAKSLLNAAIWYRRAIAEWNRLDPEVRKTILGASHQGIEGSRQTGATTEHSGEAAAATPRPDETPAPTVPEALKQALPIIEIILEASDIERCAFDESLYRKFELWPRGDYLPGMVELGALVEHAAADAIARHADESTAVLLKAGIVMCDHLAQDRLFESSDAASAIFDSLSPHLDRWLEETSHEEASDEAKKWLARLDEADPFGHRAAIRDLAARVRYNFIERLTGSSGKAMLEDRLRYRLRDPAVAPEEGEALVTAVREIRQAQWPAVRDLLAEIASNAAVAYATADSAESLAAAVASIAEQVESPDATLIRSIADVFLESMDEAARAAIAADHALLEVQATPTGPSEATIGSESPGRR